METSIPLYERDAVAAYVQAATELKQSAFFDEDFQRLSITRAGGRLIKAEFPDPNVRDAMLVSFRRLWSENEPSNYLKVSKILARRVPHWRDMLKGMRSQYQRELAIYDFVGPVAKPNGLSPNDIVDLWINARFFHSGATGRVGRFTRDDFEQRRDEIGEVEFEYLFLLAAWIVGLSYCNLLQFAANALDHWISQGYEPSFQIDTVNARGKQTSQDGVSVERATPGWSITSETPGDRVARVLRRGRFRPFCSLTGVLGVNDDAIAHAVASSNSLDEFCGALGFVIRSADVTELNTVEAAAGFCDDTATVYKNGRSRSGFTARSGQELLMTDDAYPILKDQFDGFSQEFRAAAG